MFRSLRSKLVASYGLLILLCLLLAGSAFVYQLRDYQRQLRINQIADLAVPLSWQIQLLDRAGLSSDQISGFIHERANEMGIRIMLVDQSGIVVHDSAGALEGQGVQMPGSWQQHRDGQTLTSVAYVRSVRPGMVFIAAKGQAANLYDRLTQRTASYSVVLAVPEQSLTESWLELAPSLSGAALLSLIVSIGVALLLSRSISRPVAAITRASEEMARGNYDQHIPVHGQDEVARLAEAFNRMAAQVGTSHRTLRDFLANVSHELRTPLTSIQGFSQAMVDGTVKEPEEYAESARIINEEADRMRRMVEDLLLLSKIESGQLPMGRAPVDLSELLRTEAKRAAHQAQQSGVAVKLEIRDGVRLLGDETRLEQLFQNLLRNALRHTPSGGEVTLGVAGDARGNGPSGGVRVFVHNSGSYIPPEEQSRIFERFYQVDRARSRDGAGLGLAIAREIALAHGASIVVESEPATGTRFTVAFRQAAPPPPAGS